MSREDQKQLLNQRLENMSLDTRAVRSGFIASSEGEHSPAVFMTSSFTYESASDAAAHFSGKVKGNIYSRFTNPSVRVFEDKLANLEGGERAIGTASGMGAILTMGLAYLEAGDHLLSSRDLFGSTVSLFNKYFKKLGIEVTYVDGTDLDAWQAAMQPNTKLLYCETPSNPLSQIVDIQQLSQIARQGGALLAVDNCFCTPALQRPLELGADIVIHSATKYLDGQGRAVGGALVGSSELMEHAYGVVRTGGVSMSPFNAWIFAKGLETLGLRMRAHAEAALKIAEWLEAQPQVTKVHYAGLKSHPDHALAAVQQSGFGGIIGFEVTSTKMGLVEAAWQVIDATEVLSITGNLGDVRSTITHPATTTHGRLSAEERLKAGINDGLIRLSVGLESLEDIQTDLARGLALL